MKNIISTIVFALFSSLTVHSQTPCDCENSFEWMKTTFEQNDAGFQYILDIKGTAAYNQHNQQTLERIKKITSKDSCATEMNLWTRFFRSGHAYVVPISNTTQNEGKEKTWETYKYNLSTFKKELLKKDTHDYEGIWKTGAYTISIAKHENKYIGTIVESDNPTWKKNEIKLIIEDVDGVYQSLFYMGDKSKKHIKFVQLFDQNTLRLGSFILKRTYPVLESDLTHELYIQSISTDVPFITRLNETTLYMRIPSFAYEYKEHIDRVLQEYHQEIIQTENFIIDITNGTGGSDVSYYGLLPYLYTYPIRTVGVEYKSTPLNNKRMLDFMNDPSFGFSEQEKENMQIEYEKLQDNIGKFVNLNEYPVSTRTYPEVHEYPKKVAILINKYNGSTDEQFLLAAKQSQKVKLYGQTTFGVLDISNMYHVDSPCGDYQLGYALTKSMRIPNLIIDERGVQPDYFLDHNIPEHMWISYVSGLLNLN